MKIRTSLLSLLFGCCVGGHVAIAATVVTLVQQPVPQIQKTIVEQTTIQQEEKLWGLSTEQYTKYVWLMKNTPSGHWYKNLDPAEVLALNSNNKDDMLQYAKIEAEVMHQRVTQELAFDLIYTKAYQEVYPNEKPIMPPSVQPLPGQLLQSGDHVWLFIGINTPLGKFVYQHLIKVVEAVPNTALDIYFVGNHLSQATIQAWAVASGIPLDSVNKQVTLNFGNARFASIENGKNIALPFVGIVHDQHFQPIMLSSVL